MIGKKLFLCMLLLCKIVNSQTKEYIFIGHAFGNHVLNDKSLDNSVLTFLVQAETRRLLVVSHIQR